MARPLRIDFAGAVHHVTSRGNERRAIFRTVADRLLFLSLLGEAVKRFGWSISAWVLMTNHFHLVIKTPQPNLSRGMQWLNGTYANRFNKKHKRSGHLFGGRFHDIIVDSEAYFTRLLRYVVLNPVRAGMVKRPQDHRWSSYNATVGLEECPAWFDAEAALMAFAPEPEVARLFYRDFVAAAMESEDRLFDELINGIYLGSEEWAKAMRKVVESKPRSTDHPKKQRAVGRPKMATVVKVVGQVAGIAADEIRGTRGGPLRRLVAWIGWHEGLVTLAAIASSLRLRSEGHVSRLIRRCEEEFSENAALLGQMDRALAVIRG